MPANHAWLALCVCFQRCCPCCCCCIAENTPCPAPLRLPQATSTDTPATVEGEQTIQETKKPAADQPAGDQPAADEPAADEPAAEGSTDTPAAETDSSTDTPAAETDSSADTSAKTEVREVGGVRSRGARLQWPALPGGVCLG